jgi:glycerol-3-phosphate dehydrogenase
MGNRRQAAVSHFLFPISCFPSPVVWAMLHRAHLLNELSTRAFDLLVIGGGITGAGIARDAALRGHEVALIDKSDFASGTSSRSSRLIHGGVRYLEHGHLHLVFEASAERRRLLKLAPHLVRPLPFIWPVYEGQRLPFWKLSAGLTLYDLLSLFRNVERHKRLSAREVMEHEPRLAATQLRGGVRYFDAATNDTRLTLANVLDACRLGAVAANHVAFTGVGSRGAGVFSAEDALTGERFEIRARLLVNATGPWSDAVRQMAGIPVANRIQGSKGAHIAVGRERVGNNDALTLLHPKDGRVVFALPAGPNTIIGTTDTFTDISPDEVRANESDVAYLIAAANAFFPEARLQRPDVVSAWAGIRPLMPTTGSSVAASREHEIETIGGMVTVTGGKLTTYRVMASQVVDVVRKTLGLPKKRAETKTRPFPDDAPAHGGPEIVSGLPYRMNEMRWGVEHELACTLGDLLIRRTHVAFETRDNGRSAARRVAEEVAQLLGWDESRRARELARYDAEVERIFTIDR